MQQEPDSDTGIRVTVVPTQSAFFAGETFSVKVTFTNTRSTDKSSGHGKRSGSNSYTHKRAAHSVSIAHMHKPPTSPMTPKTAVPAVMRTTSMGGKTKKQHERRGLVGCDVLSGTKGSEGEKRLLDLWQKKAMSVSLTSQEVAAAIAPNIPSPLRDASFPANHPHARKHSELDTSLQAQLQSAALAQMQQLQLRELSASPAPTASASASTSAFSLALDTISENNSPSKSETHQYPPKRRPTHIGLGLGFPSDIPNDPPRSAFPSTFAQPGTELILYGYVQLGGALTLEASHGDSQAYTSRLNAVRHSLQKMQAIGGGRMDISSSLESPALMRRNSGTSQSRRGRTASLSSAVMNFLSPPPSTPTTSQPRTPTQGHKARTPSLMGNLITTSVSSPAKFTGAGDEDDMDDIPSETPLPTFDVQPAMLAVDLVLAPGESRSYTYSLPLPSTLPPTFRGKAMKFTYHLTVGACRSSPVPGPSSSGTTSSASSSSTTLPLPPRQRSGTGTSTSQIMRVPIRIYNHVSLIPTREPYDILRPVLHSKARGTRQQNPISPARVREIFEAASPSSPTVVRALTITRSFSGVSMDSLGTVNQRDEEAGKDPKEELKEYALRLLASTSGGEGAGQLFPSMPHLETSSGENMTLSGTTSGTTGNEADIDSELMNCREAVEVLTRNMRKVSYDVNKEGLKVAVLTFTKSAYRLGETITGVVELNDLGARARVLKLSVMLEAHETLPPSLIPPNEKPKRLRKQHAEYHASLTPNTHRASFALDIPSDAAPAFQCLCSPPLDVSQRTQEYNDSPGGLSWSVRLCLLVGIANEFARTGVEGSRTKGLVRDGQQGEWSASWRPTRGIAPLERVNLRAARRATSVRLASSNSNQSAGSLGGSQSSPGDLKGVGMQPSQSQRGWMSSIFSNLLSGEREYHDGDEEPPSPSSSSTSLNLTPSNSGSHAELSLDEAYKRDADLGADDGDGEEGWAELRAETVECEVPVRVWPGNTAFRPLEVVFDV